LCSPGRCRSRVFVPAADDVGGPRVMKNAPLFILGLFAALAISFAGIVLGSHAQLSRLTPYFDEAQGQSFPQRTAGIAARGQYVYADLGCAACHTQQVRRPDFGTDQARGWGERQSVARDYIHQARPQLGASRIGPDLSNLAGRKPNAPTEADLYRLLYDGNPRHPSYKFLFETRDVAGEPAAQTVGTEYGRPVVPTERARSLVAYLLSLNTGYDYPEAQPVAPKKAPAAQGGPVPAKHDVTPIPAAAPDEKKPQQKK
jgi:cytochrome c oxidase cbb3-type subunit II